VPKASAAENDVEDMRRPANRISWLAFMNTSWWTVRLAVKRRKLEAAEAISRERRGRSVQNTHQARNRIYLQADVEIGLGSVSVRLPESV